MSQLLLLGWAKGFQLGFCCGLARQREVRLLVIDEIHSLLAGTYREQRILLNSIRFLANDLRLPLVRWNA